MLIEKLKEYQEQKRNYFLQLFTFQEPIIFSKEIESNIFDKWKPFYNYNLEEIVDANNLHREILNNELVFDIDAKDWQSARLLALRLEKTLNKFQIPFNRWSSGNFLHYHIFLDDREIVQLKESFDYFKPLCDYYFLKVLNRKKYTIEEVSQFQKETFKAIGLVIAEKIKQNGNAYFDLLKFEATRSLIRAEGSLNSKTKAYKTYLEELPDEQPLIRASWQVKFPSEIKTWKPEVNFYWKLFYYAFKKYVKPKYQIESKQKTKTKKEKGKEKNIEWIERLLENPFSDGRKRLINLVFAPYLVNVLNYNEEEATEKINEWLLKCQSLYPTKITQTYIRYQVRYARRRKLLPLSKEKMKEKFADVEEILKVIGD
jgi:hypothetical protein